MSSTEPIVVDTVTFHSELFDSSNKHSATAAAPNIFDLALIHK